MSRDIAVTITCGAQTVPFYGDECRQVVVSPLRYNRVQALPDTTPSVSFEGDAQSVLHMKIALQYSDTLERIRAVQEFDGLVTVCYALAENPVQSVTGLVHPDSVEHRSYNGNINAAIEHELIILECV